MNQQVFQDAEMMPLLIQKFLSWVPDPPLELERRLLPRLLQSLSDRGLNTTPTASSDLLHAKDGNCIVSTKSVTANPKKLPTKYTPHDQIDGQLNNNNMAHHSEDFPSHASPQLAPIHSPVPRPSAHFLQNLNWNETDRDSGASTPGIPDNLISPAFTPPLTPGTPSTLHDGSEHGQSFKEPKSTPVDTSKDDPVTTKQPKLLERLPNVECVVRARIPTTSGAEMFLHLYQNDVDNKEHLAIVFGNSIRSHSLDAEKPGETEMDRMIRGAYTGRLRPGRVSSRVDELAARGRRIPHSRTHSGSALRNVTSVQDVPALQNQVTSDLSNLELNTATSIPRSGQQASTMNELTTIAIPSLDTFNDQPVPNKHVHDCKAPLVRIHSECYTGETAWSARCDCGEQLDEAARLMSLPSSLHQGGVIVYLRQEGRGIGLASKLKAYNLQDLGNDTVEANLLLRHPADARSYGLATAILMDLGLGTDSDSRKEENERGIRLLTNNPDKVRAVEGPEKQVRVRERVAMVPLAWSSKGSRGVKGAEIEKYLETKIGRMGHMLDR